MTTTPTLPRFVVVQHTFREHQEVLQSRLADRRPIPPLAPFCQEGKLGTWQGVPIACYSGPARETTLVPILEQEAVEYVFTLGLTGSLTDRLQRGDLVTPVAAVRGDGLTGYWADERLPAAADASGLAALLASAQRLGVDLAGGVFYSTSTLYREGSLIEKWASLGVVGIEMEVAPHFLLSHLHRKRAAGLYAVSDLPLQGDEIWRHGVVLDDVLLAAYTRAVDVLLGAIESLSKGRP